MISMDTLHSLLLLVITASGVSTLKYTVVNTTLGRMRGFQETILNKTMDVFYGIPFAKPPIGDLRFRRPEGLPPWGDCIKDMLETKASCLQPPIQSLQPPTSYFADAENLRVDTSNKSEDCLYLNMWAPHSAGNKMATLVWIHGGAFYSGSTNVKMYDGTYLAAANDVIVVTLNYRLGPFGFLYTGSDDAPGNQGLLDQTAALKWIHSNIEQFGGNRNKITLFGESAGSVMVNHHLFSPLSRNYFTSAIMESGSSLAQWGIVKTSVAKQEATKLATLVGCKKQVTEQEVASCLRGADPQQIILKMFAASYSAIPFVPTVDGHFLPDHPRAMLNRGNVKNASVILGVNKNEANFFLSFQIPQYFNFSYPTLSLNRSAFLAIIDVWSPFIGGGETVKELLIAEYELSIVPSLRPSYLTLCGDLYNDITFTCPNNEFTSQYATLGNDVFVYSFEHRISTSPFPEWTGVMHSYELELVFGHPLNASRGFSEEEKIISKDMMTFWTNFAKTGNPNGMTGDVRWSTYDRDSETYIVLDRDMLTKEGLRHRQCTLWLHTLPLTLAEQRKEVRTDKPCITNGGQTPCSSIVFIVTLFVYMCQRWCVT